MIQSRRQRLTSGYRDYTKLIVWLTGRVNLDDPFLSDVTRQAISDCHNYEALLILFKALTIPGYQDNQDSK